jgi:hypothetical protein
MFVGERVSERLVRAKRVEQPSTASEDNGDAMKLAFEYNRAHVLAVQLAACTQFDTSEQQKIKQANVVENDVGKCASGIVHDLFSNTHELCRE